MSESEIELIKRLNDPLKREAAFSILVSECQERIYWHIRKMVLVHEDADDVMQNTFLKAWKGLDTFRGESLFVTWLYRIASNETMTFLNNKKSKWMVSFSSAEDTIMHQLEADKYFNANEVQLKFQKSLLTLPSKQRLVFNMKYFDELTYEQISEIVGTSVGALKASYHHAVKKIEKYFEENEGF
jgi:RNA polymerase sigma-70 factor (ECF subfamily)